MIALLLALFDAPQTYAVNVASLPNPPACVDYQKPGVGEDYCDTAIANETDPKAKSVLLFRRAYIKDATGDFSKYESAISDLTEAIALFPENWAALHERGYLYNEEARWRDALADLDKQISISPNQPQGYQERALARFQLGDLKGAFDDREKQVQLQRNAASLLARAHAEMWLGRFEDARVDLAEGTKLAAPGAEADFASDLQRQLSAWQATSGSANAFQSCRSAEDSGNFRAVGLVGDCTRGLIDAKNNADRAEMLTGRAEAELFAGDNADTLTDSQIAVALDPSNAGWHSNLGNAYLRERHSAAALVEFNATLAIAPSFYGYAGRANAYWNLGKTEEAFADAKKSFEMKPNIIALMLLGDIAYLHFKDEKSAKLYWMGAYRLGDRGDALKERFGKIGVSWPPPDDQTSDTPEKIPPLTTPAQPSP